jgi:protein MpaA
MMQLLPCRQFQPLPILLEPLFELAGYRRAQGSGEFCSGGRILGLPRFRIAGPEAGPERIRLGLFAALHGDEPAGAAALVRFAAALARQPQRAAGYELFLYPVCNPTGYEAGSRENAAGRDLNREFWRGSDQPEVRLLEAELRQRRFHGIITLHTDDSCDGLYGYAHGQLLNESLLRPALAAAERVLPRDRRERIDGFAAMDGMVGDCFQGILSAPPDQRPRPFDLIFETPGQANFEAQVNASVAALDSILAEYRVFIAYTQDL